MADAPEAARGQGPTPGPVGVAHPQGGGALGTLRRPASLNAFNKDLLWALHDAVDELSVDREIRVVILTGEGRAFSAGLDLNEGHFDVPGTESMAEVPRVLILQKGFPDPLEKNPHAP